MEELYTCKCGGKIFAIADKKIICSSCAAEYVITSWILVSVSVKGKARFTINTKEFNQAVSDDKTEG